MIEDTVELTHLRHYTIEVIATQAGTKRTWRGVAVARYGEFE